MQANFSDFINQSLAERDGEENGVLFWVVYVDGENRVGAIYDCIGNTEYDAKENAWEFYSALKEDLGSKTP